MKSLPHNPRICQAPKEVTEMPTGEGFHFDRKTGRLRNLRTGRFCGVEGMDRVAVDGGWLFVPNLDYPYDESSLPHADEETWGEFA